MLSPHQLRGLNCPEIFVVKAHSTHECWYNPDQKTTSNVDVAIVKPQYKGDNSNRHSKSCENYDGKIKGVLKDVQSNNNATEHQVNFCKI